MSLEMPSDPFGTPGGVFAFLDPLQGASPLDNGCPLHDDPSPSLDFILDFEPDFDPTPEVVGGPTPLTEVNPSPLPIATLIQSMPTILEEEDGDITITPSKAQRALLPPDRFARPPSAPRVPSAPDASQDEWFDPLDTPRPRGESSFAFHSSVYFGYRFSRVFS